MREKLIELLDDIQRCGEDFDDYEIYGMRLPNSVSNDDVADHLIANGVTIQKWIPVTERLPEDDLPKGSKVKQIKVLTALKSGSGLRIVRSQMRYRMTWYNSAPWAWKCSGSEITHWMPLPEPPKGE